MRYNINDHDYVSVTELTGMLDKGDPMLYWAGKMALETGKPDGFKDFRNETKDTGNDLHGLIENYINCCLLYADDTIIYIPEISLKDYSGQIKIMFETWLKWKSKYAKKFLHSEMIVVNEKLCYAGTLDCIYINNNNETCLVDWKTKDAIYDTDGLQVVAYKNAIESMHGSYKIIKKYSPEYTQVIDNPIKIDRVQMLTIPREKEFNEKDHFVDFTKKVEPYTRAFNGLLDFYYSFKQRRMNNYRANERIL